MHHGDTEKTADEMIYTEQTKGTKGKRGMKAER
jgi:hypothetical protein